MILYIGQSLLTAKISSSDNVKDLSTCPVRLFISFWVSFVSFKTFWISLLCFLMLPIISRILLVYADLKHMKHQLRGDYSKVFECFAFLSTCHTNVTKKSNIATVIAAELEVLNFFLKRVSLDMTIFE